MLDDLNALAPLVPRPRVGPPVYLDTASIGLPPAPVVEAMKADVRRWAAGAVTPPDYDADVDAARSGFARMLGVSASTVAIGSQVSVMAGTIASSLPPGARVLCAEGDFSSVLFPFLAQRERGLHVQFAPLEHIADAIEARTTLVAVSAVQSADGAVADLDAIADAARHHGALTFVDATQAAGWLPIDAAEFDAVAAGTYKWLVSPRGAALMTVSDRLLEQVLPLGAGWYAGADRWGATLYGGPLRLASGARRLDVSPAWSCWVGAAAALRVFEELTVARVHAHDVALANALRERVGLEPYPSAIVSLAVSDGAIDRLRAAGIVASVRNGRLRASFHLHNEHEDVERLAELVAR